MRDLFLSKKFLVALFTAAGAVTAHFGLNLDPMTILTVMTPFLVYLGAQGWADVGKEKAKVEGETAIARDQLAHANTVSLTMLNAKIAADAPKLPFMSAAQPGLVKLRVLLLTAVLSVPAGMVLYGSVSLAPGCAHPAQSALIAGQCILDDRVLSDVLAALSKPDYLNQIAGVAVRHVAGLIDCALQAVAAQPDAGPGTVTITHSAVAGDTLSRRAREVLAARQPSVK
jgi:hypothetical protein